MLPENNRGPEIVPQILTNRADEFIYTEKQLMDMGYQEINLNLGCPSGTVVGKGRGSGFLAFRDDLNRFLEEIYRNAEVKISIKPVWARIVQRNLMRCWIFITSIRWKN